MISQRPHLLISSNLGSRIVRYEYQENTRIQSLVNVFFVVNMCGIFCLHYVFFLMFIFILITNRSFPPCDFIHVIFQRSFDYLLKCDRVLFYVNKFNKIYTWQPRVMAQWVKLQPYVLHMGTGSSPGYFTSNIVPC